MKALAVLFAGELTGHALEPCFGGESAFSLALRRMSSLPGVSRVLVCTAGKRHGGTEIPALTCPSSGAPDVRVCAEPRWTAASFFAKLTAESADFDHVFLAWADCPFIDTAFTGRLFAEKHLRYAAEYTFADGYPDGLAPDILARGIAPVLAELAKDNSGPVTRNLVFETIRKDINSFDVETDIAPVDLRQLRLVLACDTARNLLLCRSLEGIDASNYGTLVAARATELRTLPAFYAVQVAGRCPFACAYCPYPAFSASGKAGSPGVSVISRSDFMKTEDFARLVDKIAAFSGDAVVSLSLWGECSYHPDIANLVRAVLSHPGLSVLIETTGIGWKDSDLDAIASAAASAAPRANGQNPVNWIVSLDAVGSAIYGAVHGIPAGSGAPVAGSDADRLLRAALATTERLSALFPGAVWPQMVRMNENEVELEPFYRFWKQKYGQVIVQKHDHFCKSIADRRVADLSPLVRNPCWHLKRDMCILIDGTVPLCREDLYATQPYGNALAEDLFTIWGRLAPVYEHHCKNIHEGMCGACDEYYTYNF